MNKTSYECTFCKQKFVQEKKYIDHSCKEMQRDKLFKSVIGQSGWILYQKWMKSYGRSVPNANGFLNSKYFISFMKFATLVKKTKLVDIDLFILIMKQRDISPTLWVKDQVYALYLEYIDKKLSPKKHAEITVKTLLDLADDAKIDVSEIFTIVTPIEIINLLRERRLSPWILLNSVKFKYFLIKNTTSENRIILESLIRPSYWKEKFANNPELVKLMRRYVTELNL